MTTVTTRTYSSLTDEMCESCGKVRIDHEVIFPDGNKFGVCGACLPSTVIPMPRTP